MVCHCPAGFPADTYAEFDRICESELRTPIAADQIINRSKFCANIPKGYLLNDSEDWVTEDAILLPINNKSGVYHLWCPEMLWCLEHNIWRLECAYVGKGQGHLRAKDHLKKKYPETAHFQMSFYACANRIAKYLEQLFLDSYKFDLNSAENDKSKGPLYAYWSETRTKYGTETERLADFEAMQEKNGRKIVPKVSKSRQAPTN